MSPITEAVEDWRNNKIGDTTLLRAIVSYSHWKFPISEDAAVESLDTSEPPRIQLHTDPTGKTQLLLWSTPETYSAWVKAAETPFAHNFIDATGAWVFGLPFGEEIDEILLDPLTPPGLFYRKEQFADLHAMAAAINIEKDLADLRMDRFSNEAVVRVRAYPRYVLPVAKSAEGQRLIIAPDHQQRAFAPVFTADDAARNFLVRAQAATLDGEELIWVELPGTRVFAILAALPLTGVVFNCEGPTESVAFGPQFAKGVLEA